MPASAERKTIHTLSFLYFITELRKRLIYCFLFFICLFFSLFPFANHLYTQFTQPLCQQLPVNNALIATTLLMPLWIPCQLIFFLRFYSAYPFFFYQLWSFVKPALYPDEKSILAWFLLLNGGLFYSGIGLGYQFILPLFFNLFIHATPVPALFLPTIESYLNFTISFLFLLGLLFDIPLWMALLVKFKGMRLHRLRSIRRYYIIFSFILAMLLTPPDVLCQILLAVPLCLFFEIGLILCRYLATPQNTLQTPKRNGY